MIQYNNFLMKREQSRAGSRFAECEKSRLKAKILITLALLLTAVTGAWAQEEVLLTTVTPTSLTTYSQSPDGIVTVTLDNISSYDSTWGWTYVGSVTVEAAQGYTITRCVFRQNPNSTPNRVLVDDLAPFTATMLPNPDGGTDVSAATSTGNVIGGNFMNGISSIEVYGYLAEPPIKVTPGEAANTWTFSMPGSDVVLTPQYAPAAQLDENGAPAAVSGLEIAADAAIITEGQSAQGTLLYAVNTSAEAPALTAFSATLPNAKDLTAAGTYYVWYYIQGHDTPQGQEPSAENTFNDSEIMGPVTVELLTNEHTLNIKQSPNITVTVAGTAKTPTDDKVTPVTTGQEVKIKANTGYKLRKVEVKKKEAAAAAPITVTWNNDDLTGSGKSFTKDGVTVTADNIDFREKNFMGGGTFTTTLGNFTKIEVTTGSWYASGSGWSGGTWTGTPASSVSFSGDIMGMGKGKTKFVFTIEPTN